MLPLAENVIKDLEHIAALASELKKAYETAFGLCYSKSFSQEVKVSGSGVSDPTSQIVTSSYHQRIRQSTNQAAKHIEIARRQLLGAVARLNDVLADGDYVPHPDFESFELRAISEDEHKHWLKMQAKRESNG